MSTYIIKNGKELHIDEEDGETLPAVGRKQSKERKRKLMRPTKMRQENFLVSVAKGNNINQALKDAHIKYQHYLQWKRKDADFSLAYEQARAERANYLHEENYEKHTQPAMNLNLMNPDTSKEVQNILKNVQTMQNIVAKQKEHDSPTRFGKEKETVQQGNVKVVAEFDDQKFSKLMQVYSAKLSKAEEIIIPDKDIVLAEIIEEEQTDEP